MVDTPRVLIADGHELMRESLSLLLGREESVEVVGAVGDGEAALSAADSTRPDAVILDIGPRINGIEVSGQLRERQPDAGIILISSHDRAEYMKEFLKDDSAGKAYLLKTTLNSTRDLVRTIQDVCVGRTVLDPAMVSKLTTSTNVRVGSELKGLTNRELQVLALMSKAHSNRAIAEILFIQPRTVEHHISSILAKLGFNADGEYHGRVHAVLTYLDATGQLPLAAHEIGRETQRAEPVAPTPFSERPAVAGPAFRGFQGFQQKAA
jgi:DNA-binding NarL/FixJ family response regulator